MRGALTGYRATVERGGLTVLFAASVIACGDSIPMPVDAPLSEVVAPDASTDAPDIGFVECGSDLDCVPHAQCCLEVACLQGRCMPRYVPDCCTVEGPCAVDLVQHVGTCEETCVARGCVRSLDLDEGGCDLVHWDLALTPEGLASMTIVDGEPDRVTWHLSTLRPFDGGPSLRAGDVLCPTYHTGAVGPGCDIAGEGGAVRISVETPPIAIPTGRAPTLAELVVYADLQVPGEGTAGALAVDRLDVMVLADGLAAATVWSTSPSRLSNHPRATSGPPFPMGRWTPLLIDLSPYAGRNVRLRLLFDTLDGHDNDHEGVAIGRLRVRGACRADRQAASRGPCEVAYETPVHPLADALMVFAPPLERAELLASRCEPCDLAETCARVDTCDLATCDGGRCVLERELTVECCTSEPRWAGDPSFEEALSEEWELTGLWGARALMSRSGSRALHFGLEDGSALAPDGQASEGLALSPPIRVHEDAPTWRFALNLSTEWDLEPSTSNPGGIDLLEAVVVLVDDPRPTPEVTVVWDSSRLGGTTLGRWELVTVGLDSWAGRRVRLGWRFETGDIDANGFAGAFIDDAVVFRSCPGCGDGPVVGGLCD